MEEEEGALKRWREGEGAEERAPESTERGGK